MSQLIRFSSDALPDIRALVQLSSDQLKKLAQLLDDKNAALPIEQEFEDRVAQLLGLDSPVAEAVVRISLILQGANLDTKKAVKAVEGFMSLVSSEKPADKDGLLGFIEEKQEDLVNVLTRKRAISRELQRRSITSGTQPVIDSIRTLVQLRPLFERNDKGEPVDIECLIPAMTLELKFDRDGREHSATFSLTEETLSELVASLKDASSKWALLKQKYSEQMCE